VSVAAAAAAAAGKVDAGRMVPDDAAKASTEADAQATRTQSNDDGPYILAAPTQKTEITVTAAWDDLDDDDDKEKDAKPALDHTQQELWSQIAEKRARDKERAEAEAKELEEAQAEARRQAALQAQAQAEAAVAAKEAEADAETIEAQRVADAARREATVVQTVNLDAARMTMHYGLSMGGSGLSRREFLAGVRDLAAARDVADGDGEEEGNEVEAGQEDESMPTTPGAGTPSGKGSNTPTCVDA